MMSNAEIALEIEWADGRPVFCPVKWAVARFGRWRTDKQFILVAVCRCATDTDVYWPCISHLGVKRWRLIQAGVGVGVLKEVH